MVSGPIAMRRQTTDVALDDVLHDDPRIAAAAGGLRARGVGKGDVVGWRMANGDTPMLLYRACWRLGAVAAPVHHLGDVEPTGTVVDDLPEGPPVARGEVAVDDDDLAVMLRTSGSSGMPKIVLHSHRTLSYKTRLMVGVHGLTTADAVLMPAPLAHISGLLNGVLVTGATPFKTVWMAKWDPAEAAALIERERVTFMIGPPTFFVDLMAQPVIPSTLRLISSGGAGVTPAFCEEASARFGARVKRTYGSTEAPSVTSSDEGDPVERGWTTDGHPIGDAQVRLGAADELHVRGPELFVGYADAAHTAAVMTDDGWFRTGDTASIDDDGWVTITGRLSATIIRGGENISIAEVQSALERHPGVRQAAVAGYADDRLGERVGAVVVADAGFDLAACQAWFAEIGVARFKTPERLVRVDAMPTLAAGKPDPAAVARLLGS
jgi:cyclohexanecarboxylate-CoA ligase